VQLAYVNTQVHVPPSAVPGRPRIGKPASVLSNGIGGAAAEVDPVFRCLVFDAVAIRERLTLVGQV